MTEVHTDLVEFFNALQSHYLDDEYWDRNIPKTVGEWLGIDNKIGCDVWKRKYQYQGESFPEWVHRVSGGNVPIAKLILDRKFLFGGRILSNRGVKDGSSMFNCHTLGAIPDSYEEIMKNLKDLGTTLKGQGGQGLSLSKLRPKGAPVGNRYQSDGIVPFMKMFNAVTEGTANGGSRRGALMMQLNAKHKEALEFIKIKQNSDQITAANISLEFDDDFMGAVEEYYNSGTVVTLHQKKDYSGHIVEWDVVPIQVFKEFCKSSWDYAEPSALFMNRLQNYNMMEHDPSYIIEATNPCGEQPLIRHGSCCLGSINLSEFIIDPYTNRAKFDFNEFEKAVWEATIALDALIDENLGRYPLKEQEIEAMKYRNIGLGIMGLGTMYLKLGLEYGNDLILEMIMQKMLTAAFEASAYAAKEKGPYPEYSPTMLDSEFVYNIPPESLGYAKKYGLRNCSLLTVAPTGSLSTMLGISGGGEAEFAISYNRRVVGDANNGEKTYKVYCKAAKEYMSVNNTDELPPYFKGAADIYWPVRIDTQALLQSYVDSGISSTINLPNETPVEDVEKLYLLAWKAGLKGCTIYRSGCKREGILTTDKDIKKEEVTKAAVVAKPEQERGRIKDVPGGLNYRKYKIQSGCGSLYLFVGVDEKDGKIYDCFTNTDGIGGCTVNTQAVSRLMSACIRGGVSVDYIIKQLEKSGSCASYQYARGKGKSVSPGKSCPSAIAHILKDIVKELAVCECDGEGKPAETEKPSMKREVLLGVPKEEKAETAAFVPCPSCGEPTLAPEGGCSVCFSCGWSRCG